MAVPDTVNLRNLSGTFNLNKTLSDSSDAALKMQGIGWVVRQAVKYSNITLHVKQFVDENGLEHIDNEQVTTGNIRNTEERVVDYAWHEKDDKVFGMVTGRSRFVKLDEIEHDYLKQGWDEKFLAEGDREVFQSIVNSVGKKPNWTADQVWGFEVVDGQKRHTRRIIVKRGKEEYKLRLVYDWVVETDGDKDLAY
ncbi:hypothetical protein AUEXF2481DRAFT_1872 [Aureobasidium subglaciale EXF-2481]|uniref:Uncharacterized protein n=1 Tax=Aureobasidium subglaciale (strain EXF-2481) TaxID=1043005 RepID=A0A074YSA9_AURSE|nr:uncharacterized protein AUEXF2481DRAFT_1872 [Aureobasidium subglaciale EXF-2481]KEQ99054.1 hypothetical protein AUEXF2481DRAFT_1872 [Aureobasidium subglaciale EXF-2481]